MFFTAYRRISKSPKTTTSRINLDKKIYFSHIQGLTLTSDIPDGVQVYRGYKTIYPPLAFGTISKIEIMGQNFGHLG